MKGQRSTPSRSLASAFTRPGRSPAVRPTWSRCRSLERDPGAGVFVRQDVAQFRFGDLLQRAVRLAVPAGLRAGCGRILGLGKAFSLTTIFEPPVTGRRHSRAMFKSAHHPERRARVRRRIATPCTLDLGASGRVDGMLRELDDGGARVKVGARNLVLSGTVHLQTRTGVRGAFSVVWQVGQQIGLRVVTE